MKRIQSIAISAILLIFLFVSCDLDNTVKGASSVSFTTSVSKSLNESASTESTTVTDVNQYYWLYYAGPEAPGDSSQFLAFKNLTDTNGKYSMGLGSIDNLLRGESYYFALKGYSFAYINNSGAVVTCEADLRWYGVSSKMVLNSSRMNISLAVAPAGQGSVEFDFTALEVANTDASWFEICISSIKNESSILKTLHKQGQIDANKISFKSEPIALDCGCYMISVQQQVRTGLDENCTYTDIKNRGQVLLIQVESGFTTVITGSLDSSTEEAGE